MYKQAKSHELFGGNGYNKKTSGPASLTKLPSSPGGAFAGILFIVLGVRGTALALFPCLEMSFIGILLRTSRPPNDPELLVPCNSLSMLGGKSCNFC